MSASPPSQWPRVVGAVCVAQATAIVGFDFTLPFIPLYLQRELGVHGLAHVALWAGLIGFGPAIPATIFGPLWGRLADRFGYRVMLVRAMFSAAALLSLMGLAPTPAILLGLRMIQGALTGTVFAAQALVASVVPERETGRAMGLLQMSVFMGATMGPLGGGAVADVMGYRATYLVAGLLLAAATLVVLVAVREPQRRDRREAIPEGPSPSIPQVLRHPAFAAAVMLTLVVQLASTAQFPILPLYVQDLLHGAPGAAGATGWLMAASGLAAGVGSFIAGRLQRALGLRPLLVLAIVASAALFAPQAFVGDYTPFLLLRCTAAVAFGALLGLVGTLAAISSPKDAKGTAFGLMGSASSLGFGIGPLMGGSLAATLGMRPIFLVSAALLGLAPPLLIGIARAAPWFSRLGASAPRVLLGRHR